jgi:tetratricopeptide (TPR) repeat protein
MNDSPAETSSSLPVGDANAAAVAPSSSGAAQNPRRAPNARRHAWLITPALAVMTIVVYLPVLDAGFITFDDGEYVNHNPRVLMGLSWSNVAWALQTRHFSNWHPVTWLSHMLDAQLYGDRPAGHHLTNVLIHAACAIVLMRVLHAMTGAVWRSAVVAMLFAWHPLHVESVAWVSERKDVLAGLFWLLTTAAYVKYVRAQTPAVRGGWYAAVIALFAVGLMSKAMLVTLPAVLLLLDYWPLGRLQPRPVSWRAVGRLALEKLPLLLLAVGASAMSVVTQRAGGSLNTLAAIPLGFRMRNAVVSYGWYLLKTVAPTDLAIFYPHPATIPGGSIDMAHVALSAAALAAISVVAAAGARRRPYLLVGWLWFLGTLVPVIGLVQVGGQARADRYTYIPLIGVFVAIAWCLGDWASRTDARRRIAVGGVSIALVACLALTSRQASYWHDDVTLFAHALESTRNNYVAYNNLGTALADAGEYAAAEAQYVEAVRIKPDYANGYASLGATRLAAGDLRGAAGALQRALQLEPNHPAANNNLGNALAQLGRADEAEAHYRRAVAVNPALVQAQNNLAMSVATRGQFAEAAEHARMALRANPASAQAHHVLGLALAMGGGDAADGVSHLRRSIALQPAEPEAFNSLAWVLTRRPTLSPGGVGEAVELASRANELTGYRIPKYLDTLASALAATGRRADAAAVAQRGLAAARAAHDDAMAAAMSKRVASLRPPTTATSVPTTGPNPGSALPDPLPGR